MLYKNCKLYDAKDPKKKVVKKIDIETDSPLSVNGEFTYGDVFASGAVYQARTRTQFDYIAGKYNLIIPEIGDYKLEGYVKVRENFGSWKPKYRYTLILRG